MWSECPDCPVSDAYCRAEPLVCKGPVANIAGTPPWSQSNSRWRPRLSGCRVRSALQLKSLGCCIRPERAGLDNAGENNPPPHAEGRSHVDLGPHTEDSSASYNWSFCGHLFPTFWSRGWVHSCSSLVFKDDRIATHVPTLHPHSEESKCSGANLTRSYSLLGLLGFRVTWLDRLQTVFTTN